MNPFNVDAGDTPAPANPLDVAIVERSARVIWRAFPYFAWRYGERGASFGRSDAGYLVTLGDLAEDLAVAQVDWLANLLAARGMPTLLLEVQLEHLARLAARRRRPGEARLPALAAHLRRRRLSVMDAQAGAECELVCRAASRGDPRRRGAGLLIASAVADAALGLGPHDEALVRWLGAGVPEDAAWSRACEAARELARSRVRAGA